MLAKGLRATRTGYFRMTRRSGTPRARAVITYGFRSSSSRFARMIRMSCAVPASPRIRAGSGRCFIRSHALGQTPRRLDELVREEPADAHVEVPEPEVHEHEGEHEARDGETDEADERRHVVPGRVLADGRVDADRKREDPREDDGGHRDDHGEPEPVSDDLGDRALPLERHAEPPLQHLLHPPEVLDQHGLVEAVLLPERVRLLLRHGAARGRHLGDVGRDVVARRQLDDDEGKDGDGPHREQREDQPLDEIRDHGGLVYPGAAPGPPPGRPRWPPGTGTGMGVVTPYALK